MFTYYKDANNIIYAYDETQTPKEGLIQITEAEKDEIHRQQREEAFNAMPYTEKRRAEYPPIADYVDGVVKGDQAQIDAYIQACLAVKAKYPKPQN
jgi:hypothetical protein